MKLQQHLPVQGPLGEVVQERIPIGIGCRKLDVAYRSVGVGVECNQLEVYLRVRRRRYVEGAVRRGRSAPEGRQLGISLSSGRWRERLARMESGAASRGRQGFSRATSDGH